MKKLLIFVLIAVLVGAIVVVNIRNQSKKPVKVKVEALDKRDLTEIISASGKIQPQVSVDISADISGKIMEVAVRESDVVRKGDLLLRLDATQYREALRSSEAQYQSTLASLSEAEARLEQQQLEFARMESMYESKDISDRDYISARTSLKLAEAQLISAQRRVDQNAALLEQQRDRLDKTEIRAPMSGVIVQRNADVGEIAIGSSLSIQVLMVIADLSVMEVVVDVDETEIPMTQLQQRAEIEIDAFPDGSFQGRVTEIANSPQQSGGDSGVDFRVVITLDESYKGLRPGLSATAEITTASREQVLSVPIQALTMRSVKSLLEDEKSYGRRLAREGIELPEYEFDEDVKDVEGVMVFVDGYSLFKPVDTGIVGEKHFEILSGLTGDERIIIAPMREVRTLRHGQQVRIDRQSEKSDETTEDEGGGVEASVEVGTE